MNASPMPDPCPHGFTDPAWCDLCRQGIGAPKRLVASLLLDEGELDEVYRRLVALVSTPGVTAWQVQPAR